LKIGKRYESEEQRRKTNRPLFSVVMDEFAPFRLPQLRTDPADGPGNAHRVFVFHAKPATLTAVGRGFKEDVLFGAEHNHDPAHERRGNGSVFLASFGGAQVTRRSLSMHRWKLFGFEKYEETGRAVQSEDKETRALDEHIKNLPKGQMEILMTDDTRGRSTHCCIVRPPTDVTVPELRAAALPTTETLKIRVPRRKSSLQEARRTGSDQVPRRARTGWVA